MSLTLVVTRMLITDLVKGVTVCVALVKIYIYI